MGRVRVDVVIAILGRVELHDESVCEAVLRHRVASVQLYRRMKEHRRQAGSDRKCIAMDHSVCMRELTCRPSGELSWPPRIDTMYGFFLPGRMQSSFSFRKRAQAWKWAERFPALAGRSGGLSWLRRVAESIDWCLLTALTSSALAFALNLNSTVCVRTARGTLSARGRLLGTRVMAMRRAVMTMSRRAATGCARNLIIVR